METFTQKTSKNCFACHNTNNDVPNGIPAMNLNISHILKNGLLQRNQALTAAAKPLMLNTAPRLMTFADVQKFLNDFCDANGINPFTHGRFWNAMKYQDFVTGNVPGIGDFTSTPLRILVPKDSKASNIIMALRGTKGTIFDPNSGSIGRMPPGGPFMADSDIDRLADWIDRGALDGTKSPVEKR